MGCLCSKDVVKLNAMATLALPPIPMPPIVAQLALALAPPAPPPISAQLSLALGIPPLSVNAAATLAAVASAAIGAQAMGIPLLSAKASAQLAATIGSINLNLPLLAPLLGLNVQAMLNLSMLASVVAGLKAQLGINLAAPGALGMLQAKLAASASLAAPAMSMSLTAALAAALGINLAVPGAVPSLTAALAVVATLQLPPLTLPPLQLAKLIGILAATASIKAALGVNLMLPGAVATLNAILAVLPLSAMANLTLAASIAPPVVALKASAAATAALVLPPLSLPMLASISATASLVAQLGIMGISLRGVPCPLCAFL
jgi:hypothetical protein